MEERKHISKTDRKSRHKRQMIYYSFWQKYLQRSADPQVQVSTEEDKRVSAERCPGMRDLGVLSSRQAEKMLVALLTGGDFGES